MKATFPLALIAAACLGGVGGFVAGRAGERSRIGVMERRRADLEGQIASLLEELDRLRERDRCREETLLGLKRELVEERAGTEAAKESPSGEPWEPSGAKFPAPPRLHLNSAAEADAVFEAAFARLDFRSLFGLVAALLALGEPGYEKLAELLGRIDEKLKDADKRPFENPLIIGLGLRTIAESHEDVLRFGLWLKEKDPETLHGAVDSVRNLLFQDEVCTTLLGFYDGDDDEIREGFLQHFNEKLGEGLGGDAIQGIAQVHGEEATDILLDLAGRVPQNLLKDVAFALAHRGDRRALSVLVPLAERLREDPDADPQALAAVEVAIRALK